MKVEKVDGSTVYSELYSEYKNGYDHTWNFLIRRDGSVSIYYTLTMEHGHHVVYDSLDGLPMGNWAREFCTKVILNHLSLGAGIQRLAELINFR